MSHTESFNRIKHRFSLMKNGILSDSLRAMNLPHRIIWGLNLPQLREIAADFAPSMPLALALWADTATRESVLIAPMLMPRDQVDRSRALTLVDSAPTPEAVDLLCHALLRHEPYARDLMEELAGSPGAMRRYAAMRLLATMVAGDPDRALHLAKAELQRGEALTRIPASNIIDDIEFL